MKTVIVGQYTIDELRAGRDVVLECGVTLIRGSDLQAAVPEVARIYATSELSAEDIKDLRPGPIQVVYPLDEEWNCALRAAIDACNKLESFGKEDHRDSWMGNAVTEIEKLMRETSPSPPRRTSGKTTQPIEDGGAPFSTPGTIEP